MKVIEISNTPEGTKIQLEDWREQNTEKYPNLYGFTIGAYPAAKNNSKYRWIEGGKIFRLSISMNKYSGYLNGNVLSDFEALKTGTKKLEDLHDHFWNGEKDMWYLGLQVENNNY